MKDTDWNFGDMLDAIGEVLGDDDIALIEGERVITWPEMTARSNRLARYLRENGIKTGDKAGFYMRNAPEYTESLAACFKGRFTHVNVNYRYLDDELTYIFDNSDSTVVFFETFFRDNVVRVKGKLPKVKLWIEIGADSPADFALDYEAIVSEGDASPLGIERSGNDLLFLYTGGTTGMPKGVMWPHHVWRQTNTERLKKMGEHVPQNLDEHADRALNIGRHSRLIPACPLMHGTGLFTCMGVMLNGGTVVTLTNKARFDTDNLWQTVDRHKITNMAIVGDAFAKPMVQTLEDNQGKYDVSSVLIILSSGVMWSHEVKQDMIRHMPQVALMDSFGASEAVGFGMSVTTAEGVAQTTKFEIGENAKVFNEDEVEVVPGSGEAGFIARGGAVPLGYYKDEEKTAKTFKTINGVRYSIPGDWCTVEEDGTITLIGRGSNCINTAGEKVFPEEVEEALKEHESVSDALVVGVPDDKWGQAVTAIVSTENDIEEAALIAFVQTKIARYKAPKRVLIKDDLGRAANGKADYKSIKAFALDQLGLG